MTGSTIAIIILSILLLWALSHRVNTPTFRDKDYMWVHNASGEVPPIRVPIDLEQKALVMMRDEDADELMEKVNPWTYSVELQDIRSAMLIAREEPDIEYAMMMWLGHAVNLEPPEDINAI